MRARTDDTAAWFWIALIWLDGTIEAIGNRCAARHADLLDTLNWAIATVQLPGLARPMVNREVNRAVDLSRRRTMVAPRLWLFGSHFQWHDFIEDMTAPEK
ncbi:hypothetical protein [Cupriavidus sp. GA3-3]|uniref:hypothetical protein n=1 Tax=Cupriavidus sp. GA3-3 TaxID=1229514 RepID=UPI001182228D|nr:hypothetical protein [Cupriavidus sp. GA3-3]